MRFKLDKSGIKKFKGVLAKRLKEVENKSMEYLWKELYTLTPKDTGAARSSWNISVNTPNYEFDPSKTNTSISIPQSKINDTLVLATGCPYMSVLNNGWSQQAPKNFIQISILNTKKYINTLSVKGIE